MLRAAITFFAIAILAFIFGSYGIAGLSMEIGKILLVVFLILAALSLISGVMTARGIRRNF